MLNDLYILRNNLNLSQKKLAKRSGLSKTTILQIESGQVIPKIDTVCMLAHALNLSPGDLFNILVSGEDFAMKGEA